MVFCCDVASAAHFKAGYNTFVTSAVCNKGSVFVGFLLMTLLNVFRSRGAGKLKYVDFLLSIVQDDNIWLQVCDAY